MYTYTYIYRYIYNSNNTRVYKVSRGMCTYPVHTHRNHRIYTTLLYNNIYTRDSVKRSVANGNGNNSGGRGI